ncbi:MAG: FAD-binding oxidoreductase [Gammaproteobacteria bacterium]|nr:FAD-binding oxidoreductase [Gammaproteobacteria bacterium]
MSKFKRQIFRLLKAALAVAFTLMLVTWAVITLSGDPDYDGKLDQPLVNDITQLNPVYVAREIQPTTIDEIADALRSTDGAVSIGGGRYSQGGQTALENSLHLDMRKFNQIVSFSAENKHITVQSGITWRKLQQYIDPHNLSVKIMQTYADFTVGGSVSVNVHGRYIGHGPIISSVRSLKLVLADGSVVDVSVEKNQDLFYAAIGGYGGIGVIAEVTLDLADNTPVERKTFVMPVSEYKTHFFNKIRDDQNVVFHNGDLYPPDYDTVRDVSWNITDKEVTSEERLIPEGREYFWLPKLIDMTAAMPFGEAVRQYIFDPLYYIPERVVWRNWEASYDVRELGSGDRSEKTYVLQEYFVPVENFEKFVPKMRDVFSKHDVEVLNVSIRHAQKDSGSYLAWARNEVFAFVVYYQQKTDQDSRDKVAEWTREMIDAVISVNGAYYLPYQPHASEAQFRLAYPEAQKYFDIKQKVDPQYRFRNKLWEKYYPSTERTVKEFLASQDQYLKGEEQTFLSLPEWYLVFNPNEYASFLASGNNPSNFPFFASIDEYWALYDRVVNLTEGVYPENPDYITMLNVIGISTTVEYLLKGIYENTIGLFSFWSASELTQEDKLISQAHQAYGDLINIEPWYNFQFLPWVKRIWVDTPFFDRNFIRKFERKLIFTTEFVFKSIYATLIGFGARNAYDPSNGLVTLSVTADPEKISHIDERIQILKDFGSHRLAITVNRWGDFTEIMPKLLPHLKKIHEISGNDDILISFITGKDREEKLADAHFLFSSMVVAPENQKRLVFACKVNNLSRALKSAEAAGMKLEHIYDY